MTPQPLGATPRTADEQVFYGLGFEIGHGVLVFALRPAEVDQVMAGVSDTFARGIREVDLETIRPKI